MGVLGIHDSPFLVLDNVDLCLHLSARRGAMQKMSMTRPWCHGCSPVTPRSGGRSSAILSAPPRIVETERQRVASKAGGLRLLAAQDVDVLVPVLAAADTLDISQVMALMRDLTRRARTGRLRGSKLSQPSISVSNLGDQGVERVIGVNHPPQVALIGFGAVVPRPWAVDGLLAIRPLVTVTLAADHRATDAAIGARLLKTIDRILQTPEET